MLDLCGMSVVRSEAEKKLAETDFCRTDLYCEEKMGGQKEISCLEGI
jgi:hypothetical protein